eukprot:TRINITY_DN17200_c0_g1_i1.p1 TRINITY_DN17200_c0_g1~~TRINITY_DN17200_c0_g1_i1.p1  ORF type:complete len:171 (+),score=34.18 TRINITY_DN17200_c0_g1_i1:40-513(+)
MAAIDPRMVTEGGYKESVSLVTPGKGRGLPKGVGIDKSIGSLLDRNVANMEVAGDEGAGPAPLPLARPPETPLDTLEHKILSGELCPPDFPSYLRLHHRLAMSDIADPVPPEQILEILYPPASVTTIEDPPPLWTLQTPYQSTDRWVNEAFVDDLKA